MGEAQSSAGGRAGVVAGAAVVAALVVGGAVLLTGNGAGDDPLDDIPLATIPPDDDIPLAPIPPDDDIPLSPIPAPPPPGEWRGTITLDGRTMELHIDQCGFGEDELLGLWDGDTLVRDGYAIWIEGDVAGGVFDISQRLYPPFGWNDTVNVEIGRRGWYSHDPTHTEDWFWFDIDGRRITGETAFRFYEDYEADYDDHVMVTGSIDVVC